MKKIKPEYANDLFRMTITQRTGLVISIRSNGHVLSCYIDNIWDFAPYLDIKSRGLNKTKIDFSLLEFNDGSFLTDPQHSLLLAGAKEYLYVRLTVVNPMSGKPLSESSLIGLWQSNLRPILRWMVENGFRCFADISSEACLAFVAFSKESTRSEFNKNKGGVDQLTADTLSLRFSVIESLWTFRGHLSDTLLEHPWPGHSAISLSGCSKFGGRDTTTEQIPDRLMSKLVMGSLNYVSSGYGERLLDCRDAYEEKSSIEGHLTELGMVRYPQVLKEITKLRTACFVIISAFSGMRISEVLSLEMGCYYEHVGWDGADYGWLKGTTYKLEEDPKPGEWMVPPVVQCAVNLATRVSAKLRDTLENKISALDLKLHKAIYLDELSHNKDFDELNKLKQNRNALFVINGKASINRLTDHSANYSLKALAKFLELNVESSDLDQVRDKTEIKVGMIWPLASHQFRKTFARYVARCILGDVRYLKEHYKHWSLDMTLGYAWNEDDLLDPTLVDEILDEHQDLQSDIVMGWVDLTRGQHLAGVGGDNIERSRERTKKLVATDPRAAARQISKGYFLRGLGHSWCTEKECRGKGIYSVIECKACENRVIDESHKPMWYGIRQQQIELLHVDDCGDPMWQGAVESLRYAEQTLKSLGEEIEPYLIPPKPSERKTHV